MPAVLDRPTTDTDIVYKQDDDMQAIWVLFIFTTPKQNSLAIQPILEKAMPELNGDKIRSIIDELRTHDMATILKDTKDLVERYYLRLQHHQLSVRMERE